MGLERGIKGDCRWFTERYIEDYKGFTEVYKGLSGL